MGVGDRIKAKMKEKKISQNELARIAQVSQSGISYIIKGISSPKENTLQAIASALDCSVSELLGEEETLPSNLLKLIRGSVPLVGEIACGTPIMAQENIETYIDTPDGIRADFALRCRGNSMVPTFNDGDLVLIRQQDDADDGKIVAVMIEDNATLKRIHHLPGGITLQADNTAEFAPMTLLGADAANVRILGVAVGYVRMI